MIVSYNIQVIKTIDDSFKLGSLVCSVIICV